MFSGNLKRFEDTVFGIVFASLPFLVFFGLFFLAGSTFGTPSVNVEYELNLTDEIIMRVEENMLSEPPQIIIDNMSIVTDMQSDAWHSYEDNQQMLALNMTRQAREIALRVERMPQYRADVDEEDDGHEIVLRVLEQNTETIEELAPAVDEFGDEIIREDFAAVVEMQNRAWEMYSSESYVISGELAQLVRDRLQQIRRATIEAEQRFGPERLDAAIERAREMIFYAENMVFPEAIEAVELLSTSIDILGEAEFYYLNGKPREAKKLIDETIQLSQRSIEIARHGGLAIERMEDEFSRTEELIAFAEESINSKTRPEVKEMISRATELLIEAQSSLGNGSVDKAQKLVIEARRMADLAKRSAIESGDINKWNVEKALDNTDNIIEHSRTAIEDSNSPEAMDLLERAIEVQAKAREHFEAEEYKEALSSSRASADVANQAMKTAKMD
ncbi:hypothetical protein KAH81_02310 [bacterium]|nr:hypothetical protein [bacterium]